MRYNDYVLDERAEKFRGSFVEAVEGIFTNLKSELSFSDAFTKKSYFASVKSRCDLQTNRGFRSLFAESENQVTFELPKSEVKGEYEKVHQKINGISSSEKEFLDRLVQEFLKAVNEKIKEFQLVGKLVFCCEQGSSLKVNWNIESEKDVKDIFNLKMLDTLKECCTKSINEFHTKEKDSANYRSNTPISTPTRPGKTVRALSTEIRGFATPPPSPARLSGN